MHAAARQTLLRRQQGAMLRSAAMSAPARMLHGSAARYGKTLPPSNESRTSGKTSNLQHPGYTDASTPVSDEDPAAMPSTSGTPSSQAPTASTKSGTPHEGVHEMAEGAKIGGSDAIHPEERNVKNWGPNQRTPEFNPDEGRRNPVLHGGSNEGGFDKKTGKSKT